MTVWTDFVKKWAKENGKTYGCALSDPKLKEEYRKQNPKAKVAIKERKAIKGIALEEAMPSEPAPKNIIIRPPSQPTKAPVIKKVPTSRIKKVIDIVRAKQAEGDEIFYYVNRFLDKPEAYDIINGKVMIIGKVTEGDYGINDLNLFKTPKAVAPNVRFYNKDNKPITKLNDLQENV